MSTFVVTSEQAKSRLDALVREFGSLSQKKAKLLCALGGVAVNGVCATATTRLREGAKITFQLEHIDLMLRLGLPIAYADEDVVVVQKPPGLAVQTTPQVDTSVETALEYELPASSILYHLDREASGLLLIARHPDAATQLDEAFKAGNVSRDYTAITHGAIAADEQVIELPATAEPGMDPEPSSSSHVIVLGRREGATHVRVTMTTGRAHQIRRHLQSIGHAILGDARFGDAEANDRARASWGVHRTLLHGKRLTFSQPKSGEVVEVIAADEPDFARIFPTRA